MVLHASENIITRDGATVIAGRNFNTVNGEVTLFITKINPFGTVVWSKKIKKGSDNTDFQLINGIKELNNGNFVIVYRDAGDNSGSAINVIQLSNAGNLLWTKELTTVAVDDSFLNVQMAVTDNNDIIIAATIGVEEWAHAGEKVPLIIKMDNSGNILYNRWFAGNTCSSSTITGVITDKNMLYAFGRSSGCPIPGNAEIDENIFAFKMDHQTGELLQSRSYFSTRTQAYPLVKTMHQWVYADMVKSNEDYFTLATGSIPLRKTASVSSTPLWIPCSTSAGEGFFQTVKCLPPPIVSAPPTLRATGAFIPRWTNITTRCMLPLSVSPGK